MKINKLKISNLGKSTKFHTIWCTPKLFLRFKCEFEGENNERRSDNMFSNTLKIERCVEALGQGLGRVTSGSIIHTNMHKQNNKLINA
jgi:hypothetical protein